MPHLTALRCRACTMMGGTEVRTAAEELEMADFYSGPRQQALENWRAQVGGEGPPRVGEFIELQPCLIAPSGQVDQGALDEIKARTGRPCPLVPLRAENGEAASLVSVIFGEHTRPLALPYFDALSAGRSEDERHAILLRVMRAVQSPEVVQILYPAPKGKK